ncbi:C-terminal processing peptidase [Clostridium thermobutyricum]|uniref:C-terminal processing peptidase n=1 Tax=Clostridium thermobutyricum TaxID=29372 RepID=N9WL91_9CLOT|nr:S41 family peptidase [Clostridium thermobutyricum]ENZ03630.1 C-terminal processing peptidase [Clostridium thermobutyricum]
MRKEGLNKVIIAVAGVVIATGAFYAGNIASTKGLILTNINSKVKNAIQEASDTAKYKELFDVRNAIISNYDGEVEDKVLLEGAIKGMANSLKDPYTIYMTKEEYESYNEHNSGEYVGIGVHIGIKDSKVEVVKPMENSPAKKAGIKPEDIIVEIDGQEIKGDIEKASKLIKGKKGEAVNLVIESKDSKEKKNVKIIRGEIKTEDVIVEMLSNNIGYIQITGFNEGVTDKLKKGINSLKEKGMKGLILDLRGNPGGYLHEAIGVASQFIKKGETITYTINKYDKKEVKKSKGGVAEGMPLVTLIDGGSASASEVVTGALRDYKVATIVGENSFGKGIVQAPIEFSDGSALKVTISKYYTPNGENIHKKGIKPDIVVEIPKEVLEKPYDRNTDIQLKKAIEVIEDKIK